MLGTAGDVETHPVRDSAVKLVSQKLMEDLI
jgi:hypothetical protein